MTIPASARTQPTDRSSSKPDASEIELHLFDCGHGDTILIRFPGDRWALIDCHLPKHGGTWRRFVEFIESRRIQRLEFIFQTHPDSDHFHGMVDVLDYFSRDGRTIGLWCDGGTNTHSASAIAWPTVISQRGYAKLQRRLDDLIRSGKLNYHAVNERTYPITPRGYGNRIEIIPIGPSGASSRQQFRKDFAKKAERPHHKAEANGLSVLLVLSVRFGRKDLNVLLAADAGPDQLEPALERWRAHAKANGLRQRFHVIKVPHHGSATSHFGSLCRRRRRAEPTIAAISAGTRDGLPSPQVMDDYLSNDWTVLCTTTRHQTTSRNDRPSDIINRGGHVTVRSNHLLLTWNRFDALGWSPEDAEITKSNLDAYR